MKWCMVTSIDVAHLLVAARRGEPAPNLAPLVHAVIIRPVGIVSEVAQYVTQCFLHISIS